MRYFKIAQLAVVLGALALPACSGGDLSAQSPSAGTAGASVVPQTVLMGQPASLRGFAKAPESVLPSPAAAIVQTQSLRGFAVCVTCTKTIIPTPAPSASPTAPATVKTASVRGLTGHVTPPQKTDH